MTDLRPITDAEAHPWPPHPRGADAVTMPRELLEWRTCQACGAQWLSAPQAEANCGRCGGALPRRDPAESMTSDPS